LLKNKGAERTAEENPIGVRPRLNIVIGNGLIEDEMIGMKDVGNADFARRQLD
tara:strand:- start:243 stop:401 length:159 start_codon:yes stop_codon:yes gene_type:complete